MRTLLVLGSLLVSSLGVLLPSSASACHNGVVARNPMNSMVRRASQQLQRGQAAVSLRSSTQAIARLESARRPSPGLLLRAREIQAVSVIRLRGAVTRNLRGPDRRAGEPQRHTNLREAIRFLRAQDESPRMDARVAEALVLLGQPDAAAELLRPLRDADLMPDAVAFVTLAQAEAAASDSEAADSALSACRARAGRQADRICTLGIPHGNS